MSSHQANFISLSSQALASIAVVSVAVPPLAHESTCGFAVTDRVRGNFFVAVQFVILVAMFVLPRGSAWSVSPVLAVIAFVAIAVGFVSAVVALIALGKSLSANPVPVESGQLKTTGLYRLVRHPVYSGIMAGVIGYALISGSWLVAATVVALGALFAIKARFEEKLLAVRYPAYAAYASRVGRFIPGVGRFRAEQSDLHAE